MGSYAVLNILLIACGLGGLALAAFIYIRKRREAPLVCPVVGHSCDPVVRSDYSCFLGIPVEILGMLYYAVVAGAYAALAAGVLASPLLSSLLLGLSAAAFFFSLYLTAVQAFILREWCTWCLISAGLCAVIFVMGLAISGVTLL